MKFKTTAIAMAVAGTVAAPVAVQAGADEIYASARVGAWYTETADTSDGATTDQTSDTEIKSFSSRFGARGETDLGNGLTGFGRYEWDVDENDFSIRHRYVGLKGDFGSVLVGQTYHTFYNFVVGPVDTPWWHSGYAMVDYVGRTDKGLTYAGSSDNFAYGITTYMAKESEEDKIDVVEAGLSFTFGNDMVLGVAVRSTQADCDSPCTDTGDVTGIPIGNSDDDEVYAIALSGIMLGDFGMGFNFMTQDDDTSFAADVTFNDFYLHIEAEQLDKDSGSNVGFKTDTVETGFDPAGGFDTSQSAGDGFERYDDDRDRVSYTLGYTQSLGRKTSMWYELNYIDEDSGEDDDDRTAVMAVLKYDII